MLAEKKENAKKKKKKIYPKTEQMALFVAHDLSNR